MTHLYRVIVDWTNFRGAPGISTFYCTDTAGTGAIDAFFTSATAYLAPNLKTQLRSSGDVIEDSDGAIVGSWTGGPFTVKTSAATGGYAGSAGAVIRWRTNGIVGRRHLVGRTYLVPLSGQNWDSDGTQNSSIMTALTTAANTLVTNGGADIVIWSRPFAGNATTPARPGSSAHINGAVVLDISASLRSRRA